MNSLSLLDSLELFLNSLFLLNSLTRFPWNSLFLFNSPWLVLASRWRAHSAKVSDRVSFTRQDLWKADLSQYDVLCFVLVPDMMEELERKLEREMKPSAYAIAGRFPLASWQPLDSTALLTAAGDTPADPLHHGGPIDGVWVYSKPEVNSTRDDVAERTDHSSSSSSSCTSAPNATSSTEKVV
jgi:hypothetical protein